MAMNATPRNMPTIRAPKMCPAFQSSPRRRRRVGSSAGIQTRMLIAKKDWCWSACTSGWCSAASNAGAKCQP
jgi:hypothetical protein